MPSAALLHSALLAPFISCGDAVACNARVTQWTIPHPHRDGVATRNNSARLGMDQGLYLAVARTDLSGSNTPPYACSEGGRTVRHCCAAFRFGHSCRSDAHPAVEQSAPVCCPKSVGGAAAHRIRSDVLSTPTGCAAVELHARQWLWCPPLAAEYSSLPAAGATGASASGLLKGRWPLPQAGTAPLAWATNAVGERLARTEEVPSSLGYFGLSLSCVSAA